MSHVSDNFKVPNCGLHLAVAGLNHRTRSTNGCIDLLRTENQVPVAHLALVFHSYLCADAVRSIVIAQDIRKYNLAEHGKKKSWNLFLSLGSPIRKFCGYVGALFFFFLESTSLTKSQ